MYLVLRHVGGSRDRYASFLASASLRNMFPLFLIIRRAYLNLDLNFTCSHIRSLSGIASIKPHLSHFCRGIIQIINILSPSRFMCVLFLVVLHYLLTRLYQRIDNITIQFTTLFSSEQCIFFTTDSLCGNINLMQGLFFNFLTSLSVIQFHLTFAEPLYTYRALIDINTHAYICGQCHCHSLTRRSHHSF